ncbi:cytochrome P450 [Saccharomonospora piscinae]|uniref:cytochrome P450 n=1 Tax=Saccharomonospora piscinae TaxID=687388 RepID=UPI00111C7FD8|nr:cytochrome P450 [Saccharomonospora piscinae]
MTGTEIQHGERDLGDPDRYLTDSRFDRWREWAERDALVWSGPGTSPSGFWSVFSYEGCRQVLAPGTPFSSEYGMMIGFDAWHPDRAGGRMVVVSDGAHHARLRKVMGPFLSRGKAAELLAFVRQEAAALLESAREPGTDVAAVLAPSLPASVVCEILGVPPEDRGMMVELTNHAFAGADNTFDRMTPEEAHSEILFYCHGLIERRRVERGDDIVSVMLHDEGMDPAEVLINCDNLLIGGNETTRHAIAGLFHALSTRPGALDELRAAPDMTHLATEEVLRWTSPAMHVLRTAIQDVTVLGTRVPKGMPVVAWLPAANRDTRVFADADEFVPTRRPNKHLGFGYGPHHCLGAALARLEISAFLDVLAQRVESVALAAEPSRLRSNLVQGYRNLPIDLNWRQTTKR